MHHESVKEPLRDVVRADAVLERRVAKSATSQAFPQALDFQHRLDPKQIDGVAAPAHDAGQKTLYEVAHLAPPCRGQNGGALFAKMARSRRSSPVVLREQPFRLQVRAKPPQYGASAFR